MIRYIWGVGGKDIQVCFSFKTEVRVRKGRTGHLLTALVLDPLVSRGAGWLDLLKLSCAGALVVCCQLRGDTSVSPNSVHLFLKLWRSQSRGEAARRQAALPLTWMSGFVLWRV